MTNPTEALVLRERDARGVITLTLNRPLAFNALSESMLEALQAELDAVESDAGARVVVLAAATSATPAASARPASTTTTWTASQCPTGWRIGSSRMG